MPPVTVFDTRRTSVTTDFNFPTWRYFGRGSGERGIVHRFEFEPEPS